MIDAHLLLRMLIVVVAVGGFGVDTCSLTTITVTHLTGSFHNTDCKILKMIPNSCNENRKDSLNTSPDCTTASQLY